MRWCVKGGAVGEVPGQGGVGGPVCGGRHFAQDCWKKV